MNAFKEVMREYEQDRKAAALTKERRLNEIYKQLPRIEEIDNALIDIGVSLAKTALNGDSANLEPNMDIAIGLKNERRRLLEQNNYPADYFDTFKCALCEDTGFLHLQHCDCLKQRLIDKHYNMSNLKEILLAENFDNFDIRLFSTTRDEKIGMSPRDNIQAIYTESLNFVKNFCTEFNNLLFYGEAGLGKTFLCNCIAKDILDSGKSVVYQSAHDMFRTIERERFNKDEINNYHEVSMFYTAPLLIIDDLGTEFSTIVTQAELFNIINSRLNNKKPTIISTNLTFKDLKNVYSNRLVSRIFGNYKSFKFIGEDIRILKKKSLLK